MILEAYYEPRFSKISHGYRPHRGCHTALQSIQKGWRGVKWFIEIDIKSFFDNIDHDILLDIIFRDIKDVRFRKLLKEMLEAGYAQDWKYNRTFSGIPQGGVVSPILANIILNEFDKFVENELIPAYSRGVRRRDNPEYRKLRQELAKAWNRNDKDTFERLDVKRRTIPSKDTFDPNFRRLKCIRYADDVLLGFIGPKSEAQEIKNKIQALLQTLNLELSEEKTLITHASQQARFLGYDIHLAKCDSKTTRTRSGIKRRSVNSQPVLSVPYEVRKQWLKRYSHKGKPFHRAELTNYSDFEIIQTYDVQLRGLVNYYSLATNVSKLQEVRYHFERSLVKTLANKHKTTSRRIRKKLTVPGEHSTRCICVTVNNPRNPNKPYVAKFGDMPIKRNKTAFIIDQFVPEHGNRNELVRRLLAQECELCGSHDNVQVHHVKAIKNLKKRYEGKRTPPGWVTAMIERNRKTLVVCHQCHVEIHNGQYDGKKVD